MGREVVSAPPPTLLEWGVAARALPGERASGDLHLVETFTGGVLVAVVDALGHGEDAAVAARLAVATLAKYASEPVDALVQRCHQALRRRTRGVVMSLASFDATERTMTWLGIGNVEGFLYSADPEAYMAAYGLNKTQQKILLGNNLEKIREAIREEYRKAEIFIFPMFVGVKRKP